MPAKGRMGGVAAGVGFAGWLFGGMDSQPLLAALIILYLLAKRECIEIWIYFIGFL